MYSQFVSKQLNRELISIPEKKIIFTKNTLELYFIKSQETKKTDFKQEKKL